MKLSPISKRMRSNACLALLNYPLCVYLMGLLSGHASTGNDRLVWQEMERLRAAIIEPAFPEQEFFITDYGAVADAQTDCTDAIRKAIEACAAQGGGRVVAHGGVFKTGPVHLKSGVNLHITEGTTLSFYTDPQKYLPGVQTRYEGVELINYSPLLYAKGQRNIAITGGGTLDGNASMDNWWKMTPPNPQKEDPDNPHTRTLLFKMAEEGVPVEQRNFGLNSQLRPTFIELNECENILVEGVTLINAPFWMIHPLMSRHITIRGVTCDSSGMNNDGVDPESCENVLIEHCVFHTKDDGVAIKSGRNADGRRINRPSRNIIITDCVMNTRHTAVAIGSEMTGGVENVFVQNVTCGKIQRLFRIKTNSRRGGYVRNIAMRNVRVSEATGALIDFRTNYGKESGSFYPEVENIHLQDIICDTADQAVSFMGTPSMPIRKVRLENIEVKEVSKPSRFHHVVDLTQVNLLTGTVKDELPFFHVNAAKEAGPNTEFWKAAGHDYLFHYVNTPIGKGFLNRAEETHSLRYFRTHFTFNTTESKDVPGTVVGGDVVQMRPDGSPEYDFSAVNQTFREYVNRGMKPIVEFGFFPNGYARDFGPPRADNRGGQHEREAEPVDWAQWEALQRAFMENLETAFGKEELRTWYFEVWNEPDQWPSEHIDVFFRMYDVFAHVVKSFDAAYRVGGPGGYTRAFMDRFLEHVEYGSNTVTGGVGSPLDFVSFHIYGVSGTWLGNEPTLYPKVAFFQRDLRYLERILKKYPKAATAEFHLNEWGLSSRFRRSVENFPELEYRNNHISALFLVKLVDQLLRLGDEGSLRTDLLLYWGFTWEAERGWIFRGNRELFTGGGIAKPILSGFELMARLMDQRIEVLEKPKEGDRFGILPTRNGNRIACILYNFEEGESISETRDRIRLKFSGLDGFTAVQWKQTPLSKDYNNSYTRWKAAGRPAANTITPEMANTFNYLEVRSEGTTAVRNGESIMEVDLPSQSIVLIEAILKH